MTRTCNRLIKIGGGTLLLAGALGASVAPTPALGDLWAPTANLPTVTLAGMGITLGQPPLGFVPSILSDQAIAAAQAYDAGTVTASLLRSISDTHQHPPIIGQVAWVELMTPSFFPSSGPVILPSLSVPNVPGGGGPCGGAGCASIYCAKALCDPQLPGLGGGSGSPGPRSALSRGSIPETWRMVFVNAQTGQVMFGAASTGTS